MVTLDRPSTRPDPIHLFRQSMLEPPVDFYCANLKQATRKMGTDEVKKCTRANFGYARCTPCSQGSLITKNASICFMIAFVAHTRRDGKQEFGNTFVTNESVRIFCFPVSAKVVRKLARSSCLQVYL